MPTAIGTNVVTSIARHFILPEITDVIYNSNVLTYRLMKANKRIVQGGTQIEVPWMFQRFAAGGSYSGLDTLNVAPSDTIKNGAWDWKQYYVPVTVDGLTMIKVDSDEAIANFIRLYFDQAEMEMVENLAAGIFTSGGAVADGSTVKDLDGLAIAVDSAGTYGSLARGSNTWLGAQEDGSTATMSLTALQTSFGNASVGGRHPTLLVSNQTNYNRYWNLAYPSGAISGVPVQQQPAGHDEILFQAGFTNVLFNNVPWVVDSHVVNDVTTSRSPVFILNEDFFYWAVSPRADFYLEPFQTPINQDAMVAKLLWAGNLICTNPARQAKLTNFNA